MKNIENPNFQNQTDRNFRLAELERQLVEAQRSLKFAPNSQILARKVLLLKIQIERLEKPEK